MFSFFENILSRQSKQTKKILKLCCEKSQVENKKGISKNLKKIIWIRPPNIINVIHTMAILKTEIYKYGFMKKGLIIACAIHTMFLTTRLTSNTRTEPLKKIPLSALYSPLLPIIFSRQIEIISGSGELIPSILTPLYQAYMLL